MSGAFGQQLPKVEGGSPASYFRGRGEAQKHMYGRGYGRSPAA